jgi:hypothetical protein
LLLSDHVDHRSDAGDGFHHTDEPRRHAGRLELPLESRGEGEREDGVRGVNANDAVDAMA